MSCHSFFQSGVIPIISFNPSQSQCIVESDVAYCAGWKDSQCIFLKM